MSCVRFLSSNYADPDIYANIYKSSQQTNFPVTNALAKIRRSKVWRSNGYWNVTSSNNTLIFRDVSGGSDKTATIAVGEYSTANFLLAIDAALEAAGSANYTVSQNSNLKFVIASDLSGGATHFELRFAHASNTCESLLGFDSINYTGASSYTADFLRINSSERITIDMGLSTNITSFALTGFRNRAIKLSPSGVYKIQGNETNAWSSPSYSQTLTYNDNSFVVLSDSGLHTGPLRYWSLSMEDQNPLGYLEIGSLFFGDHYAPTRGRAQFPFSTEYKDLSDISYSQGGQSFSDISEITQTFKIKWNALTKGEMEDLSLIFEEYGTGIPFFMVFDADSAFSSSSNYFTRFVKFSGEPDFDLVSVNNYSCDMSFREEL